MLAPSRSAAALVTLPAILALAFLAAEGPRSVALAQPSPPATCSPTPSVPLASANPAPAANARPNIILILTDDQRADSLACMPRLSALLAKDGVRFQKHYASTPFCCPSRTSILTGMYAHNHGVRVNEDPDPNNGIEESGAHAFQAHGNEERIVAKFLRSAGYLTGYYGKYMNGYDEWLATHADYVPPHWDHWAAFGKPEYYNFTLVEGGIGQTAKTKCYLTSNASTLAQKNECKNFVGVDENVPGTDEAHSTDVLRDKALDFIDLASQAGKPFFLHFAPKSPHGPFASPNRHETKGSATGAENITPCAESRIGNCGVYRHYHPQSLLESQETLQYKPDWVRSIKNKPTEEELVARRKRQIASALVVEDALEAILAKLEEKGMRSNTVILFASDNGLAWGEHGYDSKNCAYEECAHVPLVILDPRKAALKGQSSTVDSFTLAADLAPTIAELAGTKLPTPAKIVGKSLVPLLHNPQGPALRDRILLECWGRGGGGHPDTHAGIRTERWKYVEHYDDNERTKVHARTGSGAPDVELYDLRADPFELYNLATMPAPLVMQRGYSTLDLQNTIQTLTQDLHTLEKE